MSITCKQTEMRWSSQEETWFAGASEDPWTGSRPRIKHLFFRFFAATACWWESQQLPDGSDSEPYRNELCLLVNPRTAASSERVRTTLDSSFTFSCRESNISSARLVICLIFWGSKTSLKIYKVFIGVISNPRSVIFKEFTWKILIDLFLINGLNWTY